jgi:hypothetical protein
VEGLIKPDRIQQEETKRVQEQFKETMLQEMCARSVHGYRDEI